MLCIPSSHETTAAFENLAWTFRYGPRAHYKTLPSFDSTGGSGLPPPVESKLATATLRMMVPTGVPAAVGSHQAIADHVSGRTVTRLPDSSLAALLSPCGRTNSSVMAMTEGRVLLIYRLLRPSTHCCDRCGEHSTHRELCHGTLEPFWLDRRGRHR